MDTSTVGFTMIQTEEIGNLHEVAFIKVFIEPLRRERFQGFLASPKKRRKFTDEFYHLKSGFLIPKFLRKISGPQTSSAALYKTLRRMGAPDTCWVIGGRRDAQQVELLDALSLPEDGVVISCIPGKLAYVKSEDEEYIVQS